MEMTKLKEIWVGFDPPTNGSSAYSSTPIKEATLVEDQDNCALVTLAIEKASGIVNRVLEHLMFKIMASREEKKQKRL